jgi:hypothetical protein
LLLISNGKVVVKDFARYIGKKVKYELYSYAGEIRDGFVATMPKHVIAIEPNGDSLSAPYVDDIKWMKTID